MAIPMETGVPAQSLIRRAIQTAHGGELFMTLRCHRSVDALGNDSWQVVQRAGNIDRVTFRECRSVHISGISIVLLFGNVDRVT